MTKERKVQTKYYTVYKNKTDEIVAFGSAAECAEKLGITRDSFHSFVSNTRSGPTKTYTVLVEDYQSDEEYDK